MTQSRLDTLSRRESLRLGAGLITTTALAGCGSVLPRDTIEKRFFSFETRRPSALPSLPNGPVMAVRRFQASPEAEGRGLVTKTDALRASADFYDEFFAPPAALIQQTATEWLGSAGLFQAVLPSPAPIDAAYRLDGLLNAIYGDLSTTPPRARIALQLLVTDLRPSSDVLLLSWTGDDGEPVADASPSAMVRGWSIVLARLLTAFEMALRAKLAVA